MLFSPNKSVFDFSLIMQVNVVCDVFTTRVLAVSFNLLCDVISQTITFLTHLYCFLEVVSHQSCPVINHSTTHIRDVCSTMAILQ